MISEHIFCAAAEQGLALGCDAVGRMARFYDMLIAANNEQNLTRITDEREAAHLHFIDSLAPLWLTSVFADGCAVMDIGAGAGFPGVPLALCRPEIRLTMVDSVEKKVRFLRGAMAGLGLSCDALHARAEFLARDDAHRESYDIVLSRAVAPLATLLELALPFVRVGGVFIAWKGPGARDELKAAQKAITTLGARVENVFSYSLMKTNYEHGLILLRKISEIPIKYPRKPDLPRKRPII